MHAENAKCQFHQHFRPAFFIREQIEQLFSNYIWLCNFLASKYWQKIARKMLMKLTQNGPK